MLSDFTRRNYDKTVVKRIKKTKVQGGNKDEKENWMYCSGYAAGICAGGLRKQRRQGAGVYRWFHLYEQGHRRPERDL